MKFFKYLVENWELIVGAICAITGVILALIRKKPEVSLDKVFNYIDDLVILYVSRAEKLELKGKEKKEFVVFQVQKLVVQKYGVDVSLIESYLATRIELVLMTPTATIYKEEIVDENGKQSE